MVETEAKRSGGIEAVAIVTPNHMHAGPTYAFLKAGVHVICDKPLTVSLAEGKKMKAAVDKSDRIFALTHNYTAYPLVRRMREMAQGGELGEIRLVQVEYPQDWLAGPAETTGNKQAEWRVDPERSGAGGALGDIGTHAFNLADYVTGLKLAELAADPDHAAPRERRARRPLGEPDRAGQRERAQAQGLRDQGRGPLGAGQPERMLWSPFEKSTRIVTRGGPDSGDAAARVMRVPPGHPEGYLEGFANIYSEVALAIKAARAGKKPPKGVHFPTIEDGVKGLAFIEAAVKSSKANAKWVKP
jgi:predicted dehydrogenase